MANSLLRALPTPVVIAVILGVRFFPAVWLDELFLGCAVLIALLGFWAGVEAWRGAKASHA